jgi:predicted dehydrogenase
VTATRVALIGATGHGAWHRRTIAELQAADRVELVGLCDVADLPDAPPGVPLFRAYDALLAATAPDLVVVSTPPHTHRPIAVAALRAGADVLLEKPPVLDLAEHDELERLLTGTGRACQVGFQALGSAALTQLLAAIRAGRLGTVNAIAVRGAWFRDESYFRRAAWVGRRTLAGQSTLDGALANPFAHAVMTVLAIADAPLSTVEAERYRTRDIEVDDTASLRLTFSNGITGLVAVSLCAEEFVAGEVTVTGSAGTAVLEYPTDRLRLPGQDTLSEVPGRTDLLANLLEHRADPTRPLLVPLARTRPFTSLLAPIQAAEPVEVDAAFVQTRDDLPSPRLAITGVNAAIDAAARGLALFSELRSPTVAWARPAEVH